MKKWFLGITNRQALKAKYKELVKVHHPDRGGNEQNMKEINSEYDDLFQALPEISFDGTEYRKPAETEKERPEDFRNALAAVIRFIDVEIEVCGDWIWLHGNTYSHKDEIKAAGYRFSANKKSWYWHDADYKRKHKKQYSMDEIRSMYDSEFVETQLQKTIPA